MTIPVQLWLTSSSAEALAKGDTLDGFAFSATPPEADMSDYGYLRVQVVEVDEANLDRQAALAASLKVLQEEEARILAEAEQKANRVRQRRQELLAIPYTPAQDF